MKKTLIATLAALTTITAPALASMNKADFYAGDFVERVKMTISTGEARPASVGVECPVPTKDGRGVDSVRFMILISGWSAEDTRELSGVIQARLPDVSAAGVVTHAKGVNVDGVRAVAVRGDVEGMRADFLIRETGAPDATLNNDGEAIALKNCKAINAQDAITAN